MAKGKHWLGLRLAFAASLLAAMPLFSVQAAATDHTHVPGQAIVSDDITRSDNEDNSGANTEFFLYIENPEGPVYGFLRFDEKYYRKKWPQTGDAQDVAITKNSKGLEKRYRVTTESETPPTSEEGKAMWVDGVQYEYWYTDIQLAEAPEPILITKEYPGLEKGGEIPEEITDGSSGDLLAYTLATVNWVAQQAPEPRRGQIDLGICSTEPQAAETATLTDDEGNTFEGQLVSVERTEKTGWDESVLYGQFVGGPGMAGFLLGDTVIPQNDETPAWDGYETTILTYLGMSTYGNRITNAKWMDDWHSEGDEIVRTAAFFVETYGVQYVASYIEIQDDAQEEGYTAVATYSAIPPDGTYIWQVTEYYKPTPLTTATVAAGAGVMILILAVIGVLYAGGKSKRKAQAQEEIPEEVDDE